MQHRSRRSRRCIALFGGSFDPVHAGHVALANHFLQWLPFDELRIIPAGNPWQKQGLQASAKERMDMVRCAFEDWEIPIVIDQQEIQRSTSSYTIDTLRAIRTELGPDTSLLFLMGADQLQKLDSWREWRHLFEYAHICVASRPGFTIDATHLPQAVMEEFSKRISTPEQIGDTACGLTCLVTGLLFDVSSSKIRAAIQHGEPLEELIPSRVLHYIQQHRLYRNETI